MEESESEEIVKIKNQSINLKRISIKQNTKNANANLLTETSKSKKIIEQILSKLRAKQRFTLIILIKISMFNQDSTKCCH